MSAAKAFLRDLRRLPRVKGNKLGLRLVDNLEAAFRTMASEALEAEDTAIRLRAIEWIISRDALKADTKVWHIDRLMVLDNVADLNLAEFVLAEPVRLQ